jgi:hypothetical protein
MAGLGLGMMGPIAGALYRAVDAGAFYFAAGAAAVGLVVLSLWARQTPTAAPAQRLPSTAP